MDYNNKIVQNDLKEMSKKLDYTFLKNKTLIITGATGMLASYFSYLLHYLNQNYKLNIKIILLVRNEEKANKVFKNILHSKSFHLIVQDICDPIEIEGNIDYILHMASSANPYTIKNNPLGIIKANTLGTFNVCELAKEKKAEILFTSTREVYGKVLENIKYISEESMGICDCLEDRACYPESKRIAETILRSYKNQFGIKYKITRIAHSYGPGMNINKDGRVMADFIYDTVNSNNIILNSDGESLRSFSYINDTILGILYVLIFGKENEVYNISNETEEIKIKDLAKKLVDLFPEKKITVEFQTTNDNSYTNYKRIGLDTRKLKQLGWTPTIDLEIGLVRTVESFQQEKLGVANENY